MYRTRQFRPKAELLPHPDEVLSMIVTRIMDKYLAVRCG